jgi:hypothetical protein
MSTVDTRPAEIAESTFDERLPDEQESLPSDGDNVADDYDPADDYRALSTPAVASLALGILSALALLDWALVLIPIAALALGLLALRQINRRRDEYTGRKLAVAGSGLALVFGIAGISWLSYTYATEVPAGFNRISYADLQPYQGDPPDRPPNEAQSLDGKEVFIKGYVYPGERQDGITRFLLVRDQGECCFGGNPKVTDRILVSLNNPKGFRFSNKLFKVAGVFHVMPPARAIDAKGAVLYRLDDATLR